MVGSLEMEEFESRGVKRRNDQKDTQQKKKLQEVSGTPPLKKIFISALVFINQRKELTRKAKQHKEDDDWDLFVRRERERLYICWGAWVIRSTEGIR